MSFESLKRDFDPSGSDRASVPFAPRLIPPDGAVANARGGKQNAEHQQDALNDQNLDWQNFDRQSPEEPLLDQEVELPPELAALAEQLADDAKFLSGMFPARPMQPPANTPLRTHELIAHDAGWLRYARRAKPWISSVAASVLVTLGCWQAYCIHPLSEADPSVVALDFASPGVGSERSSSHPPATTNAKFNRRDRSLTPSRSPRSSSGEHGRRLPNSAAAMILHVGDTHSRSDADASRDYDALLPETFREFSGPEQEAVLDLLEDEAAEASSLSI